MRSAIRTFTCLLSVFAVGTSLSAQQRNAETISLDSLLQLPVTAAAKYAQHASDAAASVTIITSGDIQRYGYRTLDEVLGSVRSFYTRYDRSYAYLGVRGFGRPSDYGNRIMVLVNGHALNDGVYGMSAAGTDLGVSLDAVERIEIARGPGSALYGTNAMLAVINLVTKTGSDIGGVNVAADGGSLGSRAFSFQAGRKIIDFDVMVSGQAAHSDGGNLFFPEYSSINQGIAQGQDWDAYSNLMSVVTRGGFTFQAKYSSREKGIPTGAWGVRFNDSQSKTLDDWGFAELKYDTKQYGNFSFSTRSYVDLYHYRGWYNLSDDMFRVSTDAWRVGGEARVLWDPMSTLRVTFGTEYRNNLKANYDGTKPDEVVIAINNPYQTVSGYVQGEFRPFSRVTLDLGLRTDASTMATPHTTPRTALLINPFRGATLKLLYGEAFRSPDIYEKWFEGGVFRQAMGLRPENIKTSEVVWEQRINAELFATVAAYHSDLNQLIEPVLDESAGLYQYQNRAEVETQGVELELNGRIAQGLSGYASFAAQHSFDVLTGMKLSNSPERLAKFGLSIPVGSLFDVSPEVRYESGRFTVTGTRTNSFYLTNVRVSTHALSHRVGASLMVRNIFGAHYSMPGGYEQIQPAIEQDGRTLSFRLDYRF